MISDYNYSEEGANLGFHMSLRLYYFLYAVCLLSLASPLHAQWKDYKITRFDTNNGLPQNSITVIGFDKAGYCWLGTEMGLVRFDGSFFKVFNFDNLPGLRSIRIRKVESTYDGELFFLNDMLQLIYINAERKDLAPEPELWDLEPDKVSAFKKKYPYSYLSLSPEIDRLKREFPREKAVSYNVNRDGEVYIQLGKFIFWLERGRLVKIDSTDVPFLQSQSFLENNYLIQSNYGYGIKLYHKGKTVHETVHISGPLPHNKDFAKGSFKFLRNYEANYIYAGNSLYQLTYSREKGLVSELLLENIAVNVIEQVYYNRSQNKIYIGSLTDGLYIVSPSMFSHFRINNDIIRYGFYCQALLSDESIVSQKFRYYRDGRVDTLKELGVLGSAIYVDEKDNIYHAEDAALLKYDIKKQKNGFIFQLPSKAAYIDKDRYNPREINIFSKGDFYRFRNDSSIFSRRNILPRDIAFTTALQSGPGTFIMGTDHGVRWYDVSTNRISGPILEDCYIRSLYQDKAGRLWIATYSKGMHMYSDGKLTAFPAIPFEGLKTVHCFIDDGKGNFFLPSNKGLFKVRAEELVKYSENNSHEISYFIYSIEDDLKTNEFNGECRPGYVWLKDSILSLPSILGLVRFKPGTLPQVLPERKIYISDLVFDENEDNYLEKNTLYLAHDFSGIRLNVSTPFFGNKHNLQLQYKIKGIFDHWRAVPENGEIIINRIPHGEYVILVKKLFDQGESNPDVLALNIVVRPPFHNTWQFYLLCCFLLVLLVYFIVRIRTNILKQYNERLQKTIDEQTRDLQDTVLRLEASENELLLSNRMKDRITTLVLHDLRSPIRFIQLIAGRLSKNVHVLPQPVLEQRLKALKSTTAALNEFTEQFFTWAASQHTGFRVDASTFDLQTLFDEVKELYYDITLINENSIIIKPTTITLKTDRNILSVIIRNIVDNANKITKGGEIILWAEQSDAYVNIYISDNGPGFQKEKLDRFFEPTMTSSTGGHGSIILNNLVRVIDAKLEVRSELNIGTTFRVSVPHPG